jgi:colicin import membrane protein
LADIEDGKRKAEAAEAARKAAEETARREALARQLAAEEAARMAAIRADAQKLWAAAIAEALRRNWLRPPDSQDNFQCMVNIKLAPNGQVLSARIASSCGSMVLDDSVIKAVYKASPLPLPKEPTAFVPDLNIRFRP